MPAAPKISVITPCYNHGKYIGEMLESLVQQTFQAFEVIIVNDGSTDDTREILDRLDHPNIRVIHTENFGPAHARNLAIENATAPVIMNLDADDRIAPTLLEKAFDVFQSDPAVGIVYCDALFFGARSGKFEIEEYTKENMLFDNRIISQSFFHKSDWELAGGYSDELLYGAEDWDFWLSVLELGRRVIKIPEPLVYYRTYTNPEQSRSGRRKNDRIRMRTTQLQIYHRHEKLYRSSPAAWEYFTRLEKKANSETLIERKVKDYWYKQIRRIRAR